MKILFFINSLHAGGKERRLVELIKGLSTDPSYTMEIVLTRQGIYYKDILSLNIKIHFVIRKNIKKDPRIFIQFYKIAQKFKPEIIHVWGNLPSIYAIPTKLLMRIPMINNQITNAPKKVSKSLLGHKLTFFFSDKIIANSYAGLDSYNVNHISNSLVIYNGFDFNRIVNLIDQDLIREKFSIRTKYIIGMVASFTDKKDYHAYIKLANDILEEREDVTFVCVGAGDYLKFKNMVNKKNKDKVKFLGKQNKVESIMNICDIGILLTNNKKHGEGISNSLLEFMALAKPVIATDSGGTKELVENGINGFITEDNGVSLVREKVLLLLSNDNLRESFGKNSKQTVENKYNISKMIEEFSFVYNEVLKK